MEFKVASSMGDAKKLNFGQPNSAELKFNSLHQHKIFSVVQFLNFFWEPIM